MQIEFNGLIIMWSVLKLVFDQDCAKDANFRIGYGLLACFILVLPQITRSGVNAPSLLSNQLLLFLAKGKIRFSSCTLYSNVFYVVYQIVYRKG